MGTEDLTWLRPRQLRNCQRLLHDYQLAHSLPLDLWDEEESDLETDTEEEEDSPLPPALARLDATLPPLPTP